MRAHHHRSHTFLGFVFVALLASWLGGSRPVEASSGPTLAHIRQDAAKRRIVNAAPIIDPIPNQTTNEDQPLSISVTLTDTEAISLATATSGVQGLVANANISLVETASPGIWTLAMTPTLNANGGTLITVTAVNTASEVTVESFTLTVQPVNDGPVIQFIPGITTLEDTPASRTFVITDVDTPLSSVSTNVTWSPPGLIAAATIAGTGANRTLFFTPTLNANGTGAFAFTANDGSLSALRTVAFTVTAVPDPPVITPPAAAFISEDFSTGQRSYSVSDPDNDIVSITAVSLSPDIVPNTPSNITLGGSPGNLWINVTPAPNKNGTVQIEMTVRDSAGLTSVGIFVVDIAAVYDPPQFVGTIGPFVLVEDNGIGPVAVNLTNPDSLPLTVWATSNNTALIPNLPGNLSITGSGTAYSLVILPASNAFGSASITLFVQDGTGAIHTTTANVTVTPVNDPPEINQIGGQTLLQNTSSGDIPITLSDVDDSASSLQLTPDTTNGTLLPLSSIEIVGSGANRILRLHPVVGQSGTATVTLTVTDPSGAHSNTRFPVNVVAVNQAPTISSIADATVDTNATTVPLGFIVGDDNLSPGSLKVSAASSNQSIVKDSDLVFGGSGANRTITVRGNQTGVATITVTVSDGLLSASVTFVVTVRQTVTSAPTITMSQGTPTELILTLGSTSRPLTFTIGDLDTPLNSLVVSAVSSNPGSIPAGNVTIGGNGSTRIVTIQVPITATRGSTITLIVSDGVNQTTLSVIIKLRTLIRLPLLVAGYRPYAACETQATDCLEPNNTYTTSRPLPMNFVYTGTLRETSDDQDIFALQLDESRTYVFNLEFSGVDLDLYLFGPGQNASVVASSDATNTTGPETITGFQAPKTGTYYLFVRVYYDKASPPANPPVHVYKLSLTQR